MIFKDSNSHTSRQTINAIKTAANRLDFQLLQLQNSLRTEVLMTFFIYILLLRYGCDSLCIPTVNTSCNIDSSVASFLYRIRLLSATAAGSAEQMSTSFPSTHCSWAPKVRLPVQMHCESLLAFPMRTSG